MDESLATSSAHNGARSLYSVVIPVYGNEDTLGDVIEALEWLQDEISADVEAVFVVDGSPDDSAALLRKLLPSARVQSQLICHSRNFGAFPAIRTGFLAARGDFVAAMAADLQEPISLVAAFYRVLASDEADIAVGIRVSREDPVLTKLMSRAYWRAYRRLVQPQMPAGGVDVFACTARVAKTFGQLREAHSSLVGQLYWLGFRRVDVPYMRQARRHGTSAWSFRKKLSYLMDSVFSFTSLPISLILAVGLIGTFVAVAGSVVVLIAWLLGAIPVPGYTALMLVLLLSTGAILSALGVVGTYVWRAYENTKERPGSVILEQTYFGTES